MDITHRPIFDTSRVEKLYSEKDGVPVKYVCTSAPNAHADYAADIFFRETPHPQHGNRYFGLYRNHHFAADGTVMITNADMIENLDFDMVDVKGTLHYSQHRHDFYYPVEDMFIDGGRSYLRRGGNLGYEVKQLKVKDGNFVER